LLPSRYTLPAEDNSITPNLEIEGIERKEGKSQPELILLTKDHLKKNYPLEEWVYVFTDGSQENGSNAGYGLHCIFFQESHAMEPGFCTFDAEVKAIARAVEQIAETVTSPRGKPNYFSICQTARRPFSVHYKCKITPCKTILAEERTRSPFIYSGDSKKMDKNQKPRQRKKTDV
jgi:hypothetical protein